jgi:hypothetical protein
MIYFIQNRFRSPSQHSAQQLQSTLSVKQSAKNPIRQATSRRRGCPDHNISQRAGKAERTRLGASRPTSNVPRNIALGGQNPHLPEDSNVPPRNGEEAARAGASSDQVRRAH